jgi:predicted enzyme related to lactoylglutathione lyase
VTSGDDQNRVFRAGGVSYVDIPAIDPHASASFYEAVFGWTVRRDPGRAAFEDGTGHVIGHFVTDVPVAHHSGVRPYIYVDDVDATLDSVVAEGGTVLRATYAEGNLWVGTFRDPAGNVVGVWQSGPRRQDANGTG